jgi:hypothetical protein
MGKRSFPSPKLPYWLSSILDAVSADLKQVGHEADHAPPSSVKELYLHSSVCLHDMHRAILIFVIVVYVV